VKRDHSIGKRGRSRKEERGRQTTTDRKIRLTGWKFRNEGTKGASETIEKTQWGKTMKAVLKVPVKNAKRGEKQSNLFH